MAINNPIFSKYTKFLSSNSAFLADPKPHAVVDPPNVEFPPEWLIDPWMKVSCVELAHQLGYPHARE